MKSSIDIDAEIKALYITAQKRNLNIQTEEARNEIRECLEETKKLEEAWEFEKNEQKHLFEETRKKYEADIYSLVERINSIEDHKHKHKH